SCEASPGRDGRGRSVALPLVARRGRKGERVDAESGARGAAVPVRARPRRGAAVARRSGPGGATGAVAGGPLPGRGEGRAAGVAGDVEVDGGPSLRRRPTPPGVRAATRQGSRLRGQSDRRAE